MSVGELLDAAFSLYRRNFLLIAAISAVVQVPLALVQFALYQVTSFSRYQNELANLSNSRPLTSQQVQDLLHAFVPVLIVDGVLAVVSVLVVLPLAVAATTRAVSDRYLDRPASVGSSYVAAIRRLGALVLQSVILVGVYIVLAGAAFGLVFGLDAAVGRGGAVLGLVGVLAAVVAGAFIYVRTSLAAPAIVLEGLSGWRGLVRSWNLVRGSSWRIFGIRLLVALIVGIIEAVLTGILGLAGTGLDASGRLSVNEPISAVSAIFVGPITYIAVTLLYYDMRIRKEGFDIEMLAQSL